MARRVFKYQRPSYEDVKKQASQTSGQYDSIYREDINVFKVKEGDFRIRVLPATWEGARHFGFEIFWHRNIGVDNQTYLCLEKMKGELCPVCEERKRAEREGEADYANSLKPVKRVMMAFIDRDEESNGVIYWAAPWQVNKDINKISLDSRSKEMYCVDDIEEGYDIDFNVAGKLRNTKYTGFRLARKSTTLAVEEETENEWIDYLMDNPLPDVLVFHDYNYVAGIFAGRSKQEDEDKQDEKPLRTRSRSRELEPELEEEPEERSRRSRRASKEEIDDPNESLDGPEGESEEKPEPRKTSRRESKLEPEERPQRSRRQELELEEEPEERPRHRTSTKSEEKPKQSGRDRLRARVREGLKNKD